MYCETVAPKHSGTRQNPIRFLASEGGTVTIIGTDPVFKWEKHSGCIYKATMEWSLGKNNQIFFDGKPLQEARWPNDRDGDLMTPDGAKIGGGSVDHIFCPELPKDWCTEELKGATVWAIPQSAWSSWTTTFSRYDPEIGKIFFPSFKGNWWVEARHNPNSKKGTFFLVGALKLLDAPGEWFYEETTQTLYLWAPQNADPNVHKVEAKARQLGIDLGFRSWISVEGINLLGCSLDLSGASHCVVKEMKAFYISHTRGGKTISSLGERSGIFMSGHYNRLANCEIAYSAGNGVHLGGTDNVVVNCWIHHIDYMGAYSAPIAMTGMRHLVSHNTIAHAGRDCIKLGGAEHLIQFNDIAYPGEICHDLGVIYSSGTDGGNTRIRYNFVHGNPGDKNVGIYLDNYMKNYIVDHNVIWNVGNGIRLNRPTGFCMVLNNTVFKDINNVWGPWEGKKDQWGCHVMNNLCSEGLVMKPEVVTCANLTHTNLNLCFDVETRSMKPACIGRGKGIPIPRITPLAQVDIGAYQHDAPAWRAGHDFNTSPSPVYTPADEPLRNYVRNAAFEYGRYDKVDSIIHWNKTHAAIAKVEYHKGFNSPPANARNSIQGNSIVLDGDMDNGIKQKLMGLATNTTYTFSGYIKHGEDVHVEFGVELPSGSAVNRTSSAIKLDPKKTWRFISVEFTTGPTDTSATIHILKQGPGKAYVDDTGVVSKRYALQKE